MSTIIAKRFKIILDQFLSTSGGKINNMKSQIYGWNLTENLPTTISRALGFRVVEHWSSFKYLGMPISLKLPSSQVWNEVLGKMAK
jgi:TolB-like protein